LERIKARFKKEEGGRGINIARWKASYFVFHLLVKSRALLEFTCRNGGMKGGTKGEERIKKVAGETHL